MTGRRHNGQGIGGPARTGETVACADGDAAHRPGWMLWWVLRGSDDGNVARHIWS